MFQLLLKGVHRTMVHLVLLLFLFVCFSAIIFHLCNIHFSYVVIPGVFDNLV